MAEPETCKVSTDDVKKAIKDSNIPEQKEALNLLDVFEKNVQSVNLGTSKPWSVCTSTQDVVGMLLLKSKVPFESVQVISRDLPDASASVPEKDPRASDNSKSLKSIVYEGPGYVRGWEAKVSADEHKKEVEGVIHAVNSDSGVIFTGSSPAIEDPGAIQTPDSLKDPKYYELNRLKENVAFGKQVINDLNDYLSIVQANPGVTINISATLFKAYLDHPELQSASPEQDAYKSRVDFLGEEALDFKAPPLDKFDSRAIGELKEALEKKQDTDIRANVVLEISAALKRLADAGANINIAWGNEDKLGLVELLSKDYPSKENPKIKVVGATDYNGEIAAYNSKTFAFTNASAPGTAIFLPESMRSLVSDPNLTIISDSHFFEKDKLSGKPATDNTFSTKELDELRTDFQSFLRLFPNAGFTALIFGYDEAKAIHQDEFDQVYAKLKQDLGKEVALNLLGSEDEFKGKSEQYWSDWLDLAKLARTGSVDDAVKALTVFESANKEFVRSVSEARLKTATKDELEILSKFLAVSKLDDSLNTPLEQASENFSAYLLKKLAAKVMTADDVVNLFSNETYSNDSVFEFVKGSDPNFDRGNLYQISDEGVSVYAKMNSGAPDSVLAKMVSGTSFAAPALKLNGRN